MNYEEFTQKTVAFIAKGAKVSPQLISPDSKLMGSGIVDSLLLTELILHVEDVLDCEIDVENFRLATFETIDSIYSAYGQ